MNEGDSEAHLAYYALHELHILPHELMRMNRYEKAAIYAMIEIRIEKEKREGAKIGKKKR